jgi:thymidylate synthase ThyX
MKPKVTLVSYTANPLQTLWVVWEASKKDQPLEKCSAEGVSQSELEDLFHRVIAQGIPVSEHLQFIFMLEGVSIEWREQAVRHRVGCRVGPRLGVDLAPDLAESGFWSQSMRILDMSTFAEHEMYRVPETLEGKTVKTKKLFDGKVVEQEVKAEEAWAIDMKRIQEMYAKYVKAGVPMEDARGLIPLGAQSRISWTLNLRTIQHIVGKRGCWILQLGLWRPVIEGMINELATKVHPAFRELVTPPCMKGDEFAGCVFKLENERRVTGDDTLPVCSLYANHHETERFTRKDFPMVEAMERRAEEYRTFWGRDPFTGARAI